ncbi:ADP-ribosyltransferase [uncultured Parabacteroides sp.]|uniref:ADP-ribosyltransferase n=1 Tax=uncultured Parabacteroides sp. TaxID=512312 RepID=UPI0026082C20|nr:ADP-ribosyltransferase [uncultured Parabacteroides sp.]
MAKPKIPNQKKKYQELNNRLNRYVSLVEQIYDALNLEAAKIVSRTDYSADSNKPFQWSDYPQTKKQIADIQSQFVNDIHTVIYHGTSDEWKNSNEVQDLMADKVLKAYTATVDKQKYKVFYQTNSDALKAFQNRKDKGFNVSAKLWQQSTIYKEELEAAISCAIQKGTSAVTLSKQISKYLLDFPSLQKDYKEKYGSAEHLKDCEYRSIRLARSEISMAYQSAENERWKQMDFVVGYEIKLSGRHPAHDVCDDLAGKYPKDFVWTGWHPNDLCYKIPILKTEDEFWAWDGRSEATTESVNEIKDVPDNFKKWVLDNQQRIEDAKKRGTLPYFLKDNQSYLKEDKSEYIEAISKYTGSYYPRINQYLRGQRKQLDNDTLSVIDGISKYINLSDKYIGTSYRGITADRIMFDKLKTLKKGNDYIENGFMSTSANKLVAEDFADGTEYKIIFEIKGKNGVDISSISDMQEEKEILFDKSSKFKITKVKVVDKKIFGNLYIYMEEI